MSSESSLTEKELLLLLRTDVKNLEKKVDGLSSDQGELWRKVQIAEVEAARNWASKQELAALQANLAQLSLKLTALETEAKLKLGMIGVAAGIISGILTPVLVRLLAAG